MKDKTVKDAMVPIGSVFMLNIDDCFDQATMKKVELTVKRALLSTLRFLIRFIQQWMSFNAGFWIGLISILGQIN